MLKYFCFQAARGGINVDTVRTEGKTTSRLTLADVRLDDSGNYTCKPSEGKTDSTVLVVVEGKKKSFLLTLFFTANIFFSPNFHFAVF